MFTSPFESRASPVRARFLMAWHPLKPLEAVVNFVKDRNQQINKKNCHTVATEKRVFLLLLRLTIPLTCQH